MVCKGITDLFERSKITTDVGLEMGKKVPIATGPGKNDWDNSSIADR